MYIHLPFCSSLCHFCGCNKKITRNHDEEAPYLQRIHKEWGLYGQLWEQLPQIAELHLGGGTPTFFSAVHLAQLIEGIFKRAIISPAAALSFEAHPNSTDREKLRALRDLGFSRLSLGIQDYNEEVQRVINRRQTDAQILNVVNTARELGYDSLNFDLIYGLPLQTSDRLKYTIEKTLELRPDRIAFYSYAHVPWVSKAQRLYSERDLPTPDAKLQLYLMGKQMLQSAGYTEVGMDHFALAGDALYKAAEGGTLHRNFMGYTENTTEIMIGLGVSSISDAGGTFAQNVKSLMEYERAIDSGVIPVFRGHIPDAKDLMYRRIILDLMCRFQARISETDLGAERLAAIRKQTAPLEEDGLCAWDGEVLNVSNIGRQFVRNVCIAVDPYLAETTIRDRLFSKTI
jgi:oxygen-independent coproporphyrinogen-3 oxidase